MSEKATSATEVIDFWFKECTPKQRFAKDTEFDSLIKARFLCLHKRARNAELYTWREHPLDSLAEVIILDQFSRNMFRDKPQAFAYDSLALVLAQEAVRRKFDQGTG